MKVRIKFAKHGAMKFVGHLDCMRYFQKAMRRAEIDIKYSEGFSPHQIMSFAAPLGVGLTSNGEYLDIEVGETDHSETMIHRLNAVMAEDMEVLSFRRLDDSAKNAMSIVAAADYSLTFREAYRSGLTDAAASELLKKLEEFYSQPSIKIIKKTKKSEKEIDIKPMIYDLHIDGETIFMRTATGSANNLKPELVMSAFYQYLGQEYPEFALQVQREEVYTDLGTEEKHRFVPLEDLGEDIE